jgi:hypothetical protein
VPPQKPRLTGTAPQLLPVEGLNTAYFQTHALSKTARWGSALGALFFGSVEPYPYGGPDGSEI